METIDLRRLVPVFCLVWIHGLGAEAQTFSLGRGMTGRVVPGAKAAPVALAAFSTQAGYPVARSTPLEAGEVDAECPPLEGPLTYMAFTATDEWAQDELVTTVSAHFGLAGNSLPDATAPHRIGILDSGAATHLIGWEDANALGIRGSFVTDFKFPVGGVAGQADVLISVPIGIFAQGVQDLDNGNLAPFALFGQGNFPLAANTEANAIQGLEIPSVLGAPFLAFYVASVRNSQRIVFEFEGERISTPSATLYDPIDLTIPSHGHQIPLRQVPGGDPIVAFFALPDFVSGGYLGILPALIGQLSGSLFYTASNNLRVEGNGVSFPVQLMVDTGAQACIFSRNVAFDLGLNLADPAFEVEVEGIGGSLTAPGVYIEKLTIPSSGGNVVWTNIPAVVIDLQGPDGQIMDGILGTSLLATRDWVFNGALASPYLDISDPVVTPVPEITSIRTGADGVVEVDWRSEPAVAGLRLDAAPEPSADPNDWTPVAVGELATTIGTMVFTSATERATLRLAAP